ncbi:MAG: type II toxin-antitoxin system HicB family antitoxin [Planctomycetota bacterium]|nr:type II toxin-antitoxin system HicB family antitoxin [Planctomycetota bacterium]
MCFFLIREQFEMRTTTCSAVVEKEDDTFVSLCPELDVASQGETVEAAVANLKEAVELFLEHAADSEVAERLQSQVYFTRFEATHG